LAINGNGNLNRNIKNKKQSQKGYYPTLHRLNVIVLLTNIIFYPFVFFDV